MYIKVIYGDGDEVLVNPNCYIKLIYEYLRIKCNITDELEMDLCNAAGELQHIFKYPSHTSGLDILQRRDTYYIVIHERDSKGRLRKGSLHVNKNLTQYDQIRKKVNKSHSFLEDKKSNIKKSQENRISAVTKQHKVSRKSDIH